MGSLRDKQDKPNFFCCCLLLLPRIGLLPAAAPTGEKRRHPIEVQFEVEFVVKLTGDIVVGWLR